MIGRTAAVILGMLLLAACQREVESDPVELSGRIFVFNYRVATATYLVTLQKIGPLPADSIATAEFENPEGGPALVTREKIFTFDRKIVLESPHLRCVRKDRPYAVTIRILDASGDLLQEIKTSITSDLDQSVLPDKPLVIGPGYAPNPEIFRPDGSTDYGRGAECPP